MGPCTVRTLAPLLFVSCALSCFLLQFDSHAARLVPRSLPLANGFPPVLVVAQATMSGPAAANALTKKVSATKEILIGAALAIAVRCAVCPASGVVARRPFILCSSLW